MKRLFALSLALIMTLSLAACGGSKTPAAGSASTTNNTSTSAPTSAKPADSAPVLTRGDQVSEDIKADDGTVIVSIQYKPLSISYPGNTEVEKTIQKDLDKVVADFLKAAKDYEEEAKTYYNEYLQSGGKAEDFSPYACSLNSKVVRQDTGVISALFYSYAFTGGAHGSMVTFARNYDAKTGKVLTMKDLGEGVGTLAIDNVVKFVDAIQDHGDAFFFDKVKADDESVQSMLADGNFYLSQDGLVLIDGEYLLQPYAAGIAEFTTSYDDLKGKLKEEYALTGGSTNCVGSGSVYTFDKDGKLVSTKTDYDPAVSDDSAQDAADGSVSASN
jgi:predicted small lipoprotein YifL